MSYEDRTPTSPNEALLRTIANGSENPFADREPQSANEYWLKQIAQNGGGSGLPAYTAADKGKVLTVGQKTETVVVVPEQTATIAEEEEPAPALLTGYDAQFFGSAVVGTEIEVTDNGNTITLTAEESSGGVLVFSAGDDTVQIAFFESDLGQFTAGLYFMGVPGSHTVTVRAERPAPSAVWSAPSPAVYRFKNNVTTPRDVYAAWNSGGIVATVDVYETPNSFSRFHILHCMSESNGTYTAYFVKLNNDFNGVDVYRITSGGIDLPFQTT